MFSLEFWQTSCFGKLQCPNMLEQGFTFSREMAFGERSFAVLGTICPNLVKLLKAFGEISDHVSSGKSSLDLHGSVPQGLSALGV